MRKSKEPMCEKKFTEIMGKVMAIPKSEFIEPAKKKKAKKKK